MLSLLSIVPLSYIIGQVLSNQVSKLILYILACILSLIQVYYCQSNPNISDLDGISLWLIWLVYIILPIILIKSKQELTIQGSELFLLIGYISSLVFIVKDYLLFYITYEFLLIPMFYLIGYYGSRNQKIQAIYEFYIYTLFGSLLLLVSLILIYLETGVYSINSLILGGVLDPLKQNILFIGIFLGFAVKIPFVPIHLWLPKAHVEAPTTVSIFLAAILLKLGTYGYLRFLLPITPLAIIYFKSLIYTFALLGIIYTSLICITLIDMKKIIAYSSIGHMNLAILALFSNTIEGLNITVYFMLSHGLISSALFLLIGILYDRYHTRILLYYKGLVLLLPLFALFFILSNLANIAFPLTSGFLSEIITFLSIFNSHPYIAILACLSIVLTPSYVLYFTHVILYGTWSSHLLPTFDLSRKEFHLLLPLVFLFIFLGIYPNIIFDSIIENCLALLY